MIAANYAADWCKAKIVCVFRLSGQPAPAWAKWSAAKFAALCVAFDHEKSVHANPYPQFKFPYPQFDSCPQLIAGRNYPYQVL